MEQSPKGKMKLGKLSMPKKKPSEMEMEMEGEEMSEESGDMPDSLGSLMGEMEDGEMDASEAMGAGGEDGPAAMLSDDELLAELRKRGLSSKAAKASAKPSSDDEYLA